MKPEMAGNEHHPCVCVSCVTGSFMVAGPAQACVAGQ